MNEQWPAILAGDLNRYHPKVLVFLVGRTELYDRIDANGSPTNINDTAYASYIREQLQRVVTMGTASVATSNCSRLRTSNPENSPMGSRGPKTSRSALVPTTESSPRL